jgi:hypothetical protein
VAPRYIFCCRLNQLKPPPPPPRCQRMSPLLIPLFPFPLSEMTTKKCRPFQSNCSTVDNLGKGKEGGHGLNNYKDTKPFRFRFYWCLIEFMVWRYSLSCWYFQPASYTVATLTFSLVSSPPLPCVNKNMYTYSVSGGGGGMGFWASDRLTLAAKSLYR